MKRLKRMVLRLQPCSTPTFEGKLAVNPSGNWPHNDELEYICSLINVQSSCLHHFLAVCNRDHLSILCRRLS